MLRLLLDHHISPAVADAARKHSEHIAIQHVQQVGWHRLPDPELLTQAHREGLTLVTYDLTTIPQYLREFAEREQPHGGVIFIDGHTIPSDDRGAIGRALAKLWDRECGGGTAKFRLVLGMKWFLGTYTGRFNRRRKLFGHRLSGLSNESVDAFD